MKIKFLFAFIIFYLCANIASSATFTAEGMAAGSFDWNSGATWGNGGNVVGVDFPGPGDAVNIPGGEIVEIPAGFAAQCSKMNLNNDEEDLSTQLTLMSSTSSLTLTGSLQMLPWNGMAGAISGHLAGNITMNGGTITIGGDFTATCYDDGDFFYHQNITTDGGILTINGDISFTNNGVALATINMNTVNSVLNVGAGFTLGTLNNGVGANGTINYKGAAGQTILSEVTYYNLTISGGGLKTADGNIEVKNIVNMTSGNVNLSGNTLTLGNNFLNIGTLSYTAGWMYGGSFKRWFDNTSTAIGDARGHFPIGSSTHYRPFWVAEGVTFGIQAEGTIMLTHTADYTWPAHVTATHNDVSWGNTLQGVSKSTWAVATGDGYTLDNIDVRFGGQGFGTNVTTDLDASLLASVVGTHAATTGTGTEPYVNRTGLTSVGINNTFRIGSRNIIQSPLPIDLILFDAIENGSEVKVEWTTASEINNDYFTIQRSKDALNWESIKQVDGAGNSSSIINYIDKDPVPYSGTSFYRLRQTDFNGSVSYSQIESVNFQGIEIVRIYPVPANQNMNLSINTSFDTEVAIELFNSIGQNMFKEIVYCTKGLNDVSVDITKLPAGSYLIRLQSEQLSLSDKMLFNISK